MALKSGEIQLDSGTGGLFLGVHYKFGTSEYFSPAGENREGLVCCESNSDQPLSDSPGGYGSSKAAYRILFGHSVSQTAFSSTPDGYFAEVVIPRIFGEANQACLEREDGPLVVVEPGQSGRGSLLVLPPEQKFDWGAHLEGPTAQGSWSKTEARKSSNWRELKAIFFLGLLSFQQAACTGPVRGIVYRCCRTTRWRCKSKGEQEAEVFWIWQILTWAERNVASLTAIHLKGSQNKLADGA